MIKKDSLERDGADGEWIATTRFTGKEPFFQDHFPGHPIVPGVLLFEAMRQTSEAVFALEGRRVRLVRSTHLRLVRAAIPPLEVTVKVKPGADSGMAIRSEALGPDREKLATVRLFFEEVNLEKSGAEAAPPRSENGFD